MVTYGLPVVCMLNINIRIGIVKIPKVILSEYQDLMLIDIQRYSRIYYSIGMAGKLR